MEVLVIVLVLLLVALVASAMGSVVGPGLFAFGLFAGGALFLLSATSTGWVAWFAGLQAAAGVAVLMGGGLEVAAVRAYLRPGGPSGAWRATAAVTGLAGSVGSAALLLWIAYAVVAALFWW